MEEKNCACNITIINDNIARLFKELKVEGITSNDKEMIYKHIFREFGKLDSEERQTYLTDEGPGCLKFFKFLWECSILDWLSDEVCTLSDVADKIEDKANVLEETGNIARWFVGIKTDLIAVENSYEKDK